MVKLKSTSASEFELIPEGEVVSARLDSVKDESFTWDNKKVDKLRWVFTITEEGQWYGKPIWGDTSQSFTAHPNCRAYNWVAAITGKKYAEGEGLETDDIVGMPCRVIIMHKEDSKQEGVFWMRVRDVLPAKAVSVSGVSPQPENPF